MMNGHRPLIYLAVTNCLTYDQRMSRICLTLHEAGYRVVLIGIRRRDPLPSRPYRQVRLISWFQKGKLFYLENHIRLFCYLIFKKADLMVANDLDTALPVWLVSRLRGIPRLMDAHEYFTEMKEVRTRPRIQKIWSALAQFLIPRFPAGYTVGTELAERFKTQYGVSYALVRNLPVKQPTMVRAADSVPFLLYQGAVNQGRGFEILIPAMRAIPYPLVICGDGNFMQQVRAMIQQEGVADKVQLTGMLPPDALREWALRATLGIFLPDEEGMNQFLALPNKFLDNIEAGLPQISRRFPEYERINREFPVARLLDQVDIKTVAETVNQLVADRAQRIAMTEACRKAREIYCWEMDKSTLLSVYQQILAA